MNLYKGQKSIRPYWKTHFENTNCLIFVVDSADQRRVEEAGIELTELLKEPCLFGIPLLVFANKQDLSHALSAQTVSNFLFFFL